MSDRLVDMTNGTTDVPLFCFAIVKESGPCAGSKIVVLVAREQGIDEDGRSNGPILVKFVGKVVVAGVGDAAESVSSLHTSGEKGIVVIQRQGI